MQLDYNDGDWHGWNGGECPVHPESVVEIRLRKAGECNDGVVCRAGGCAWLARKEFSGHDIIAFRVVQPYREPFTPQPKSARPDGGPAFPVMWDYADNEAGMTLRDYFAGQAMIGFLSGDWNTELLKSAEERGLNSGQMLALACYDTADAMIAERSK